MTTMYLLYKGILCFFCVIAIFEHIYCIFLQYIHFIIARTMRKLYRFVVRWVVVYIFNHVQLC